MARHKRHDVLTAAARHHIASKNYALPRRKGDPPGTKGHYPIHNIKHARNAVARVHQVGTPAEIRKVESRVHSKYPSIEIHGYARRHRRK